MVRNKSGAVTELLTRSGKGEFAADAQPIDLAYGELYRLVVRYRRRERSDRSRQPTALVSEAYLRRHQAEDIALDRALTKLATLSTRQSHIVELRFFSGMSTKEIAETLSVSPRTVDREWSAARAWLSEQLRSLS